ncbi:MAG: substrate-binding domain-containing protein [Capsulimonas sp.]|uniref:substrate-binding domain-containing protein n=1 Tax=Capsulimonas sp. TaxID=2494211 RepID=UPI00326534F1
MKLRPLHSLIPAASIALSLLIAGCGSNHTDQGAGPAPSSGQAKSTIGVSLLTSTNPFFNDMGQAIQKEAAANNMQVVITSADYDPAKQNDQVNNFIAQKVSAIILNPADSRSIGTAIEAANKAGIPVFTADIASLSKTAKVVSHIATDNLAGGRLAGEAMVEALGGKGKVAILDNPVTESVMLRTQGFEEVINRNNAKGPGKIEIVIKLPGGGEKDKSFKATEDIMQAHSDINGIFAINDPSALGAVAALEKSNKAGQVKVVGFDGQPEGKQAIKDGKIYADPVQFPEEIGRKTVQTIVKYMAGDQTPAQILIPTQIYKKADALADKSLSAK